MAKFIDVLKGILRECVISWTVVFTWNGYKKQMDETKINLIRMTFTDKSTIGELWIDNKFFCYTLEDTCRRNKKIAGQTAIPSGTYEVYLAESVKFGRLMPFLKAVPLFKGIMLHWGNSPSDTEGCILVGETKGPQPDWIGDSRKAFDRLYPILENKLVNGKVFITVMGGVSASDLGYISPIKSA